jgi:hypothetical protein
MKPKDVLAFAKENKVEIVDLKFVDMPGLWHHFSITTSEFGVDLFENGIGFDGSSIRGFQAINESDMLLFPDPTTAMMDPFTQVPTLSLICDIADPLTRQPYSRDPRYVARKAEKYLSDSGIADTSFWGRRLSFISSTTFVLIKLTIKASITSTQKKGSGIPETGRGPIWATSRATKKVISRWRRWTTNRTFALRWCGRWRSAVWWLKFITTKWVRPARLRSI